MTAPSPENLKTMFEFVFKGFDALDYQEHMDYDLIQSVNPEFNKAIVRVNIYREHRQTIQVRVDKHRLNQGTETDHSCKGLQTLFNQGTQTGHTGKGKQTPP